MHITDTNGYLDRNSFSYIINKHDHANHLIIIKTSSSCVKRYVGVTREQCLRTFQTSCCFFKIFTQSVEKNVNSKNIKALENYSLMDRLLISLLIYKNLGKLTIGFLIISGGRGEVIIVFKFA